MSNNGVCYFHGYNTECIQVSVKHCWQLNSKQRFSFCLCHRHLTRFCFVRSTISRSQTSGSWMTAYLTTRCTGFSHRDAADIHGLPAIAGRHNTRRHLERIKPRRPQSVPFKRPCGGPSYQLDLQREASHLGARGRRSFPLRGSPIKADPGAVDLCLEATEGRLSSRAILTFSTLKCTCPHLWEAKLSFF